MSDMLPIVAESRTRHLRWLLEGEEAGLFGMASPTRVRVLRGSLT